MSPMQAILLAGLSLATALQEPRPVQVAKPVRRPLSRGFVLPGEFRAWERSVLSARVSGYLKSLSVDLGDRVKAGQVLALVDVPHLEREAGRLKAETDLCAAEVVRAEADRALKKVLHDRLAAAQAKSPDLVSRDSVDEARGKLDVAEAEQLVARARVEVARAKLAEAEVRLSFASIRAPFDGVVTARWLDPGALVQESAATRILEVSDLRKLRLQVALPEAGAGWSDQSGKARIAVDALGGKGFEGFLSRTTRALDPKSRSMTVEIDVDNPREELRPGMYARVALTLTRGEASLVAPAAAVVRAGGAAHVWAVRDGRAVRKEVTLGLEGEGQIEILAGAAEDDEIVVGAKEGLADGAPVQVRRAP